MALVAMIRTDRVVNRNIETSDMVARQGWLPWRWREEAGFRIC